MELDVKLVIHGKKILEQQLSLKCPNMVKLRGVHHET